MALELAGTSRLQTTLTLRFQREDGAILGFGATSTTMPLDISRNLATMMLALFPRLQSVTTTTAQITDTQFLTVLKTREMNIAITILGSLRLQLEGTVAPEIEIRALATVPTMSQKRGFGGQRTVIMLRTSLTRDGF